MVCKCTYSVTSLSPKPYTKVTFKSAALSDFRTWSGTPSILEQSWCSDPKANRSQNRTPLNKAISRVSGTKEAHLRMNTIYNSHSAQNNAV
eukprot:3545254-Amphidinium_carterae.1